MSDNIIESEGKKEIIIISKVMKKVEKKYPQIIRLGILEFEDLYELRIQDNINDLKFNQFLLGWLLYEYILFDGKRFNSFIRESLDLSEDERCLLENILDAVIGFFEFVKQDKNKVYIKDILTKKDYEVEVFDLDKVLKEGDIIQAKLVKNFENKLFFFGAFTKENKNKVEIYNELNMYLESI